MAAASARKTLLLISFLLHVCTALTVTDTIRQGERMNSSETIVSAGGIFELGFFSPGQSNKNLYLGIWYKSISTSNRTVVWVANREYPISRSFNSFCSLTINIEGNLVISDGKGISLSFTSVSPISNTSATLLDSGNLILKANNNSFDNSVLWQSFDHPSDTLLPGMKFGFNRKTGQTWSLTSWATSEDPAPGAYSMLLDSSSPSFSIMKESQRYWTSGTWNGMIFSLVPEMGQNYIYNFSYISNENGTYFTYSLYNTSLISRFVMDLSGKVKQLAWMADVNQWNLFWAQPKPSCQVYALCGAFSICDDKLNPNCRCLQGFEPNSLRDWRQRDWSAGCVRKAPLQYGQKDRFILMKDMKFHVKSKSNLVGLNNAESCRVACLKNCSCNASSYVYNSTVCSLWMEDLLGVEQLESGGDDFFVRVAASELQINSGDSRNMTSFSNSRDQKQLLLIIKLPIILTMLILGFFACCLWRRKMKQRSGEKEMSLDLLSFDFSTMAKAHVNSELSDTNKNASEGRWEAELPFFSLASVSAATDNFEESNKLGQGGFGPVYKGKLLNGQEVAIKRLSKGSGQGLEELKNEATLIAKLQHRNLVRLLGCCIEDEEKILIYEYMSNKSLDFFLFDPVNRSILDSKKCIHIIEGIAQGLLYLHQHSRLRIIHRDLKASNILLDSKMNAKISDFGMARIFGGNELQANTNRVVGTYGYMSPEYVMEGLFSIKSDVFSFGVLLLEILSGKKNTSFHFSDSLTLLGHAWNLWKSERVLDLIDPVLRDLNFISKASRYINVALLCVQEQAIDRPTMSDVVSMLSNEVTSLASPKQPAFCTRSKVEKALSLNKPVFTSTNDVTITEIEGR